MVQSSTAKPSTHGAGSGGSAPRPGTRNLKPETHGAGSGGEGFRVSNFGYRVAGSEFWGSGLANAKSIWEFPAVMLYIYTLHPEA